jgi:hypothetical protein
MQRHVTHTLAALVSVALTTTLCAPALSGIAQACEGGGEEGGGPRFSIAALESKLKGAKSKTAVTVQNLTSGEQGVKRLEAHLGTEFVLSFPGEFTGCSKVYAGSEACSFKVEYAGKTDATARFEVEDETGVTESASIVGEGEGKGFVGFAFSPAELRWKSKETTAKKLEIKVLPGSDAVKLLTQKTNDATDFEVKDPNGCFGKTFTAPCSVEIKRKTTTVTGVKFWEFEYEDESRHLTFKEPFAVDLKGE